MNRLKLFALGITGAVLVTAGLYACSNDEANNTQKDNTEQTSIIQGKSTGDALIARDDSDGTLTLLFDQDEFKEDLVNQGIFAEVESIEVGEDLLTIIGKSADDFSLTAFQTELIREGNALYFPDPNNSDLPNTTFSKHNCTGASCSSCSFTRSGGSLSKITGCQCNTAGGACNHTVSAQDTLDTILDIAVKILGIFTK